jgi:hypothetical protein
MLIGDRFGILVVQGPTFRLEESPAVSALSEFARLFGKQQANPEACGEDDLVFLIERNVCGDIWPEANVLNLSTENRKRSL